jgi:hypothetical protein
MPLKVTFRRPLLSQLGKMHGRARQWSQMKYKSFCTGVHWNSSREVRMIGKLAASIVHESVQVYGGVTQANVCPLLALDMPFMILPFRPTSDPSAARTFIRNFFDRGQALHDEYLTQELRLTEPMVKFKFMFLGTGTDPGLGSLQRCKMVLGKTSRWSRFLGCL